MPQTNHDRVDGRSVNDDIVVRGYSMITSLLVIFVIKYQSPKWRSQYLNCKYIIYSFVPTEMCQRVQALKCTKLGYYFFF